MKNTTLADKCVEQGNAGNWEGDHIIETGSFFVRGKDKVNNNDNNNNNGQG